MGDLPPKHENPEAPRSASALTGAVPSKEFEQFVNAGFFKSHDTTVAVSRDGSSIEFKTASETNKSAGLATKSDQNLAKPKGISDKLPDNVFAQPKISDLASKEFLEAKDGKGNFKNASLMSEAGGKKIYQLKDGSGRTVVKTTADSGYVKSPEKDGYQKTETFGPKAEDCMTVQVKRDATGWSYKYENPPNYQAHINNDKKTGYVVSPIGKDGGFTIQHFGHDTVGDNYSEHLLADGTYIHEPPTILTKKDYGQILEIHSSAKPDFVKQAKREIDQYFAQFSRAEIDRFVNSGAKIVLGQSMSALAADAKGKEDSTFQKATGFKDANTPIGTAANPGTWSNIEGAYNPSNKTIVLTQEYSRDVLNKATNKNETVDVKSDRIGQVLAEQIDRARGVQRVNNQVQPGVSYPGETDYDRGVREWVNYYRAQSGLHPLQPDGAMAYAANIAASNQANLHGLSHDHGYAQPGWQTPVQRLASVGRASPYGYLENAYMGPYDAQYTVAMWMNSPGHRECILNPNATLMGVSYVAGHYGGYSTMSVGCLPAGYEYPQTQVAMR